MADQAPVVDRIRIIPRPDDFLDRNVGSSGEVFFNKVTNSLRVYSGKDRSGFELAKADLTNISNDTFRQKVIDSGFSGGGGGGAATITVDDTSPADPAEGQLWLDTASGILYVYYEDTDSGQWIQPATTNIGNAVGAASDAFSVIKVTGQPDVVADSIEDEVTLVAGSNINISTDNTNKIITISATATGGTITANSFTTINIPQQTSLVADSPTDAFTLSAGTGISISADALNNVITINNTTQGGTFSELNDAITAALSIDRIYMPASVMFEVDNIGTTSYTFSPHYSTNNPRIYVLSGTTVAFNLQRIPGHPFLIQDATGTLYNTGLIHVSTTGVVSEGSAAQGKDSGTLYWRIPEINSGSWRYQCQTHAAMVGIIDVKRISLV